MQFISFQANREKNLQEIVSWKETVTFNLLHFELFFNFVANSSLVFQVFYLKFASKDSVLDRTYFFFFFLLIILNVARKLCCNSQL